MAFGPPDPVLPPVPRSPCVAVCIVDPANGLCMGCLRTPEEIAEWPAAGDERKREILVALREREARVRRR